MNSPNVFRGVYTNKGKKIENFECKSQSRTSSPKVFLYPDLFITKHYPSGFPPSPNNISKLLQNLQSKFKKKKNDVVYPKLQETPKKSKVSNFIEKIRSELEAKFPKTKIKHGRSLSNSKHNKSSSRTQKFPENRGISPLLIPLLRNVNSRKDSFPECSIDFQKLDLPYAQSYFKPKPAPISL